MKALRGGLVLPDGTSNPMPRRNLAWGAWRAPIPARLMPEVGTAQVGTYPEDKSPYGVHDLVGNVEEWTLTPFETGVHVVRGANWGQADARNLLLFMAVENPRPDGTQNFALGVRCAARPPAPATP